MGFDKHFGTVRVDGVSNPQQKTAPADCEKADRHVRSSTRTIKKLPRLLGNELPKLLWILWLPSFGGRSRGIENDKYLCGGSFFTLLWQATRQPLPRELGKKTDYTEPDVMRDLISIVNPSFKVGDKKTFAKAVSNYRNCKVAKSERIPITDAITIDAFDDRVKNDYIVPLSKMEKIVADYITGSNREEWLVKQLLSLIEVDKDIPAEAMFHIFSNRRMVTKRGLREIDSFEFAAFLLGAWHYVVLHKPDNAVGEKTLDSWYNTAEAHMKREFNGGIKGIVTRNIRIDILRDENDATETPIGEPERVVEEKPQSESGQTDGDAFEWDEPFVKTRFAEPPPNTTTQTLYNSGVIISMNGSGAQIAHNHAPIIINNRR